MDALLAKLQALQIQHETHAHPAVMTCEAQAAALSGVPGVVTKNLFLKDKKGRLYIVTAAADTKVDLKVLSARLGTGKGGVRMAPDELIPTVPLGSVTPLAIAQPSAAGVALLLDGKLRGQPRICVHPLDNTATMVLSSEGLEAFVRSVGREPAWVDLEADPVIDMNNPPDLKAFADAATPLAANDGAAAAAAAVAPGAAAAKPAAAAAAAAAGGTKAAKKAAPAAAGSKKGAGAAGGATPAAAPRADDVLRATDELVDKIASTLVGEAAAGVDADVMRRLKADVEMRLNALRNAAYAGGFSAARGAIASTLSGQYA
ncbi:hypothetical protein CHLNCDRAFT_134463 [Chlorella variabilis]|uniref:YbaK/aminoacyl-tRNA synthetase-associated domain-containing protein n=1 Tax=Chlorella variabilis TaxID=554065 RepID=E1ZG15_CHLVA|nr:hypothetical protein CHLNCDRAFT_134463 [Chlorella variabilis]EFN55384.1 hypothetical protein CHLNCDRAFT_134463 [Chlorella variabilis]|eukprot:XP_005847486.1 hypothetical protein CHLNCDRAFT_134463 [Chlorella variabilis]